MVGRPGCGGGLESMGGVGGGRVRAREASR